MSFLQLKSSMTVYSALNLYASISAFCEKSAVFVSTLLKAMSHTTDVPRRN